jgi:hypothetical protein
MITIEPVVLTVNGMLLAALLADLRHRRRSSRATRKAARKQLAAAALRSETAHADKEQELSAGCEPTSSVEPPDSGPPVRKPTRFLIPSLLLTQSYQHVCPPNVRVRGAYNGFQEEFHYATGVMIDGQTFVVTHIVPVRYAHQASGGLRVADASNITALANLDRIGLPLLMHFHSHPGFGRESNRPSSVDRAFQERLERGGHRAIGGIFSRDGFVRFFAGDLDRFVVEVHGKNIRKVSDNEFKLELDNAAL